MSYNEQRETQLVIPGISPGGEATWTCAEKEATRQRLFGRKTHRIILDENRKVQTASYDLDKLDELKDQQLRFALQLADAAQKLGWIQDTPYSSHSNSVSVYATDEDAGSRLVNAVFSGNVQQRDGQMVDTFMEDIHTADPRRS